MCPECTNAQAGTETKMKKTKNQKPKTKNQKPKFKRQNGSEAL
jgi:hypothetical protein